MKAEKTAEELIQGINFPLLKEQKKALLEVIDNTDDVPKLEKLEGILNLINEIQDYAVDVLGFDENEVFDLTPDEDETQFEHKWVCSNCGGQNVEIKKWVNANTDEVGVDCEDEYGWCSDCNEHHEVELKSFVLDTTDDNNVEIGTTDGHIDPNK